MLFAEAARARSVLQKRHDVTSDDGKDRLGQFCRTVAVVIGVGPCCLLAAAAAVLLALRQRGGLMSVLLLHNAHMPVWQQQLPE